MRKITIEGRFPSMNDFIDANRITRGKFNKGNELKKQTQETMLSSLLVAQKGLKIDKPIYLHYEFYEPNKKRDLDNVSAFFIKCFQDALVKAGIIENDTQKHIQGFSVDFFTDRERPRIEIEIEEIDFED